ncbi:MAG: EAL domain-containing protein [Stappiaceae bacterium]
MKLVLFKTNATKGWAIPAAVAMSLGMATLLYAGATYFVEKLESDILVSKADSYASFLNTTQSYYAKTIVDNAIKQGADVAIDFKQNTPTVPFPATFMHGFVHALNQQNPDLKFRFYSDHPFYQGAASGAQDTFEFDALNAFRNDNQTTYSAVEHSNGQSRLRYAKAITMGESCVTCHNTRADSPKTDWKVGDIRGAYGVSIPLSNGVAAGSSPTKPILFGVCLIAILLSLFAGYKLTRSFAPEPIDPDTSNEAALNAAAHKARHLARYDSLTGLPNRASFQAQLSRFCDNLEETNAPFAIALIDLDNFQTFNDSHGYRQGDQLLRQLARRILSTLAQRGMASRLSGDEFAVLFPDQDDPEAVSSIVGELLSALHEPITIAGTKLYSGASIGWAMAPRDGTSTKTILADAHIALSNAKENRRGTARAFDKSLRDVAQRGHEIEAKLRRALQSRELNVFYQPIVDIKNGGIRSLEALVRWHDEKEGYLSPEEFIGVAEKRGMIIQVGDYIFDRICRDYIYWRNHGVAPDTISINLHETQLANSEAMSRMKDQLESHSIPTSNVTLEITEGCVIGPNSTSIYNILRELSADGFTISLDDFGTGFASLTHLKDMPIDEIKIDRSFVTDLCESPESQAIVSAMFDMAQKIDMAVIAEGVETAEQQALLRSYGCKFEQGFYFMPAADRDVIERMLANPRPFFGKLARPSNSYVEIANDIASVA